MTTTSTRAAWRTAVATLLGAALVLTACGSDDVGDAATDDTGAASDGATSSTSAPSQGGVVDVELVDFAFVGLPDSVAALLGAADAKGAQ